MNDRKNVYLLFKEIIHNAAKHAQCQNIWIDLKVEKNKFIMHIKDDGVGFDLEKYLSNGGERSLGGNGLLNIQKRAEELKANLNLVSKEGHGTELNFEMRLTRHPLN
jgi:signal transduction histidine kinase